MVSRLFCNVCDNPLLPDELGGGRLNLRIEITTPNTSPLSHGRLGQMTYDGIDLCSGCLGDLYDHLDKLRKP